MCRQTVHKTAAILVNDDLILHSEHTIIRLRIRIDRDWRSSRWWPRKLTSNTRSFIINLNIPYNPVFVYFYCLYWIYLYWISYNQSHIVKHYSRMCISCINIFQWIINKWRGPTCVNIADLLKRHRLSIMEPKPIDNKVSHWVLPPGHWRLKLKICRLYHANMCKFDAEIKSYKDGKTIWIYHNHYLPCTYNSYVCNCYYYDRADAFQ